MPELNKITENKVLLDNEIDLAIEKSLKTLNEGTIPAKEALQMLREKHFGKV